MSRRTNLAIPDAPFGELGAPSGADTPMVAAMAATGSGTGLVYARFDAQQPRDLGASHRDFTFGYEVLPVADAGSSRAFAAAIDRRMLECDLHADVITGHSMTGILEALCTAADGLDLVCLEDLALLWPHRHQCYRPNENPWLVDTAVDLDISTPDLLRTCVKAKLSSRYLDPAGDTWRLPVTTALISALLTARSLGWCSWDRLDMDPLVTESARERR